MMYLLNSKLKEVLQTRISYIEDSLRSLERFRGWNRSGICSRFYSETKFDYGETAIPFRKLALAFENIIESSAKIEAMHRTLTKNV